MKSLFLIGCLMAASSAFAQKDYCSDIKKEADDLKGESSFSGTTTKANKNYFSVTRLIKSGADIKNLYVIADSRINNYSSRGIYIKLSDSTVVKDEYAKIDCSYMPGGYYSASSYLNIGIFKLEDDVIEKLKKAHIVRFSMGDIKMDVKEKEADKLQAYFNCIFKD